ncbi:hypothetical protein [Rhizobium sp. L1K21]|uniref:hypothetical protein n=1 Tax=Rhizobium sp. L1K21 TaxID=2954933 RepID=UPI0020938F7C|nr:hypothetical protein [Rhizobium sp. L1K21]MCO6186491.1 hypothetical protein [Rhizobium sp. L1K21]
MLKTIRSLLFVLAAATAFQAGTALANDGDCSSAGVLSYIDRDFDLRAHRYLQRDIAIEDIYGVHLNRFEGRDYTHSVERQYCHATARFSDGRKRHIWYLIERNWGFAGLGSSTSYCVEGLDPWYYYGRNCRSLR